MIDVNSQGGIAFFIVLFNSRNRIFVLFVNEYLKFLKTFNRSSIPFSYFEKFGYEIEVGIKVPLNYINIVDKYINP